MKKYIGDKIFYKNLFILIIPIMLQQLLISLAGTIDTFMLNSYVPNSIAYNGVYAANRTMFIINFTYMGIAAGASIFISQFFGAKNKEKTHEVLRLSIYINLILSIIFGLIIFFFNEQLINMFVSDAASRSYGYDYLKIMGVGNVLFALTYCLSNAFRSVKMPVVALVCALCGIILNFIFNFLLIFGNFGFPELGTKGAAIATLISKGTELTIFLAIIFFSKKNFFYGLFSKLNVSIKMVTAYIKRSLPLTANEMLWSFGTVILSLFFTYKNDLWLGAYGKAGIIADLFFIIFAGLGSGTSVILGISLGQSNFEKTRKEIHLFRGVGFMMSITIGILMICLAPFIVNIFDPSAAERKLMIGILIIQSVFAVLYTFNAISFFALRSGGDSIRAFILDQLPTFLIAIPIVIILGVNANNWGLSIILIMIVSKIADLIKVFIGSYFVRQEKWIRNITF